MSGTYSGSDKRLAYLFENGGGGGGSTTVVANPSGEATDDLEKLQVGETIYDIPTGGGGSSTLAGLDDVNLSSPTDGQVLKYDATNEEWINGAGGSGGELYLNTIYSETEEKIGYWTDGKPLYQKTIIYSGTITIDNSFYTIATLSGVDQLISNEGYFTRTGGLMYSFDGGVRPESDADTYRFTARLYNNNIQVAVKGYSDIERIAITLKYTKTTDTPEVPQRGNVIYLPTIYSEEEREVGVWTDGKPLYQLGVVLSSQTIINSNAWYTTSISNANIEKIPYARGMNDEGTSFPLMANCDATGSGVNYVQIGNPRAAAIGVKEFVIQYIKTTDTAGSGSWTPSGAPAVHYSTNEQVVGTWIDGKTLYQKTYAGLSLDCNYADTWYNTNILLGDIDVITSAELVDDNRQYIAGVVGTMSERTYLGVYLSISGRTITTITIQYTKSS